MRSKVVADAWQAGRQIITLGNGGSSMTALHFVNDWNKSVFMATGKPFRGAAWSTTWLGDVLWQRHLVSGHIRRTAEEHSAAPIGDRDLRSVIRECHSRRPMPMTTTDNARPVRLPRGNSKTSHHVVW